MNPDSNQNPPVPTVPPVPTAPVTPVTEPQVVTTTPTKMSPRESIKLRIGEIKNNLGFDDPIRKKKIIIAIVGLLLVIILITVGFALIPKQVAQPLATLTPTPTSSSQPSVPSEYANDPEVLRIMDSLKTFDEKSDKTKLREDDLRLPTVDWNVSF